jgi:hypothetical protein
MFVIISLVVVLILCRKRLAALDSYIALRFANGVVLDTAFCVGNSAQ